MEKNILYYTQPYLSEFEAKVTHCSEKEGKYLIQLENTAFYPEGGGQPFDTGFIGECEISAVYEADGIVTHWGDKPLEEGKTYPAKIDRASRFDHMQHHSAEHIVSGVIHKLYGADNVGFNIGKEYITMDYNVTLTKEDIEKIEYLSNEAVHKNLPIKIDYYEGTPNIEYRSKKELSGTIRIVTIEDYDICACCGTQLRSTGEIGLIKIISFQKYKAGSRLLMVCGNRALKDYQIKENNIGEISALLSAKPYEAYNAVSQLYEEKERLKFQLTAARMELIDIKINSIEPENKIIVFEENLSAEEMRHFINKLIEKCSIAAVFSGNNGDGYKYMLTSAEGDIMPVVKKMNADLSGKGGGKGIAQGQLNAAKNEIEEFFKNI